MHTYQLLLFGHILAAMVWIGGALMMQLFALRAQATGEPARLAGIAGDIEWLGMRVLTPSSAIVLVLGISLMVKGDWAWDSLWVDVALGLYATTFAAGAGFFGPESGRIAKLIRSEGAESPLVLARVRRILFLARLDLLLLVAIAYVMVAKPTTGDGGLIVGGLVVAGAAVALLVSRYRRAATPVPVGDPPPAA